MLQPKTLCFSYRTMSPLQPAPATRAVAKEEVVMVHWQIEQCLAMSFDKPTTIALVTEAVFLRKRLSKSVSYVLVQLGELQEARPGTSETRLLTACFALQSGLNW